MAAYELLADHWDEPNGESDTGYVRHLRGEVFDVPGKHLDRLLRIGVLAPVDDEDATESDDAETVHEDSPDDADIRTEDDSDDPETVGGESPDDADVHAEGDSDADVDSESNSNTAEQESDTDVKPAPGIERPKQTAGKPVWVDYAVEQGMARDDAEALDKRELIAALS